MSQQFTFRAPRRTRTLTKPSDDEQAAPAVQPSPAATPPAATATAAAAPLSAHTPAFVPAGSPPSPPPPAAAVSAVPAVPLMTAAAFLGVAAGERPVPERVQEFMWKLGAPWEAVLYELLELWRGELAERRAGGGGAAAAAAVERLPNLYAHDPRYLQHGKQIVLAYLHEGYFNYLSHVVDAEGSGGAAAAPTPVPPPNAMQLSKREFTQRLHQFKRWAHSNTVPSSAATVRRLKEEPAFLLAAHKAEHARVAEAKTAALAHRRAMQAERKESPEERVRRALAKEERRKAREEARRVERQSRLRQKSAKLAQAMANPMYWRMQVMNQIALEQASNPAYWRHQFHADEARRRMEEQGADPTHWRQAVERSALAGEDEGDDSDDAPYISMSDGDDDGSDDDGVDCSDDDDDDAASEESKMTGRSAYSAYRITDDVLKSVLATGFGKREQEREARPSSSSGGAAAEGEGRGRGATAGGRRHKRQASTTAESKWEEERGMDSLRQLAQLSLRPFGGSSGATSAAAAAKDR